MCTFQNLRLSSISYANLYYNLGCLIFPKIMPFYAVAVGKKKGVYKTWAECKEQVDGLRHAKYKKFDNETEALDFVKNSGVFGITVPVQNKPQIIDTGDVVIIESDDENKLTTLLSRVNTLEQKLISAVSEIKSIKEIVQGLSGTSSVQKIGHVPKRKLSTESFSGKPPKKDKTDGFDKSGFKYDADGFVEVYTDGACEQNGKKNAKAGLGVFFGENHELNTAEPVSGRPTNNCGEIQAAIKAIKLAKSAGISKLCIYTDSQFLINSMTQWVKGWKKKGWKLADGSPVKNKVDFEELDREAQTMLIKWTYVKAHCGIFGNEMADQLARQGAEMYQKTF